MTCSKPHHDMSKPLNDVSAADRKFCCGGDSKLVSTMRSAAIPAAAVAGLAAGPFVAPLVGQGVAAIGAAGAAIDTAVAGAVNPIFGAMAQTATTAGVVGGGAAAGGAVVGTAAVLGGAASILSLGAIPLGTGIAVAAAPVAALALAASPTYLGASRMVPNVGLGLVNRGVLPPTGRRAGQFIPTSYTARPREARNWLQQMGRVPGTAVGEPLNLGTADMVTPPTSVTHFQHARNWGVTQYDTQGLTAADLGINMTSQPPPLTRRVAAFVDDLNY